MEDPFDDEFDFLVGEFAWIMFFFEEGPTANVLEDGGATGVGVVDRALEDLVADVTIFEDVPVVESALVLCGDSCRLEGRVVEAMVDDGVLEAENDADPLSEVRTVAKSFSVLCDRLCDFTDLAVDSEVDNDPISEDFVELARLAVSVDALLDDAVMISDAVLEIACVAVDVALRFVETAEILVGIEVVLVGIEVVLDDTIDVTSMEADAFSPSVEVVDGTVDDEFVLEDAEGVGSVGIRVIPRRDRTSKTTLSPREGELACGTDASKWDTEEELSAHRRSNLRFGVRDAEVSDAFAEIDGVAGGAGPLVVLGDGLRPGTLTGKHFDGKGLEEDHNGVDQGTS